jgi:hypothetical protein
MTVFFLPKSREDIKYFYNRKIINSTQYPPSISFRNNIFKSHRPRIRKPCDSIRSQEPGANPSGGIVKTSPRVERFSVSAGVLKSWQVIQPE